MLSRPETLFLFRLWILRKKCSGKTTDSFDAPPQPPHHELVMTDGTATHRRRNTPTTTSSSDASTPSSGGNGGGAPTITTSANLPLRILTRIPAYIAHLLRILLYPIIRIGNLAFPSGEYDDIDDVAASVRAALGFVGMFQRQIATVRPNISDDGGSHVVPANSDDEDDHQRRRMTEQYLEPTCPFVNQGYSTTMANIMAQSPTSRPLLLLYVHSPLHTRSIKFVTDYLCHARLLQLLITNSRCGSVVCFGTSIHAADGQRICNELNITRYPFLAILAIKSSTSSSNIHNGWVGTNVGMEILLKMEGPRLLTIPPEQLTSYLHTTITRHADILAAETARRLVMEDERRLRQEQDAEFQATLLADQRREAERRRLLERERMARDEIDEAERIREAMDGCRVDDAIAIMSSRAGQEPPPSSSSSSSSSTDITKLRFTLPNGKKLDRSFYGTLATVGTLRAYLIVHFHECGIEMKNFGLSTSFPRRAYSEADDDLTLIDAGLSPQAVIMVQDLDS